LSRPAATGGRPGGVKVRLGNQIGVLDTDGE